MKDRLFINGLELDVNPIKKISENYQVNDLLDFKDRKTSYTNTFSIPKTSKNINTLDGLGLIGSTSLLPYKYNSLTYFREGVQVFVNAKAVIRETDADFKVNAYFGNIEIFATLGNKKLSELDLSSLDFTLTIPNYVNRLNGDVLIYPIIDTGVQQDNTIVIDYATPSIKLSYLWDKIFAEAGFTYSYAGRGGKNDYNVFLTDLWKKTYKTLDTGFDTNIEKTTPVLNLTARHNRTYEFYPNTLSSFEYINYLKTPNTINIRLTFSEFNFLVNDNIRQRTGNFIVKTNNYYAINLSGYINAASIQELELRVLLNGQVVDTIEINEGINFYSYDKRLYLRVGDILFFEYYAVNENRDTPFVFSPDLNLSISVDNQNVYITMSNYFNNIRQIDFLKDLIVFYGLTYTVVGNEYKFIACKELLNPNAKYSNFNPKSPVDFVADDWSDKFDSIISEEYSIDNYSQNNKLEYLYDNQDDTFANGSLVVNDETLPLEKTLIKRIFKAPQQSTINVNNDLLLKVNLYESTDDKIKEKKTQPYIFYAEDKSGIINYKLKNGDTLSYLGDYKLATFNDLSWASQYNNQISELQNVLAIPLFYRVLLSLNELDIKQLDFFKLKYIKQLGYYFYLNKIKSFSNNEKTEVQLMRVLSRAQLGDFSDDFSNDFNN